MKILVLSDSHGVDGVLKNILSRCRSCDAFIHLGDGGDDMRSFPEFTSGRPVYALRGNCDYFAADLPDKLITDIGGKRIFACHGHRYGVKDGLTTLHFAAAEQSADVCLYGHTHIQRLDETDGMTILNPGAAMKGQYSVLEIAGDDVTVRLFG